jgi:hypothetical protein
VASHYQEQGELRILPRQFRAHRVQQFQPQLRTARPN